MLSHQIKSRIRTVLLALVTALVLASCAGSGGGSQGNANEQQKETSGMADHGHGHMHHGSENGASGMLMENGRYSDKAFIDAMVPHHQGAIEMAQVAREKSNVPEITELAGNIIGAQQAEIEQMEQWRREWYPQD
jgi:uncharacterized protein (DUF305 family)